MPDMLVNLYQIEEEVKEKRLEEKGIVIKRALAPEMHKILQYVKETFYPHWASECQMAFSNQPISCFIAVKNKEIAGFACYEATAKGYFGPLGVGKEHRGQGIGKALLLKCLLAMKYEGYGYAVIGDVEEAAGFYEKTAGAIMIKNSSPGIYERLSSEL